MNFFHNETFFSSNEKVNHNENEDLWKSIIFRIRSFVSNTFFFSGTVRFDTKDDGELATVVVLAVVVVVPVQVFLRIVAGYRTLTSSRRF